MREELVVIVVGERVREGQREEVPNKFGISIFLECILIVVNLLAAPVPAHPFVLLEFVREAQYLHSVVVERVWFGEIDNIEFDFFASLCIIEPEEVPLGVPIRIDVIL